MPLGRGQVVDVALYKSVFNTMDSLLPSARRPLRLGRGKLDRIDQVFPLRCALCGAFRCAPLPSSPTCPRYAHPQATWARRPRHLASL